MTAETHHFVYTFPSVGTDPSGKSVLAWGDGRQPFHADLELETTRGLAMVRSSAGAFTADECRRIVEIGNSRPSVSGELDLHRDRYRESQVAWIEPQPDSHWLYHKIALLFNEVNAHCRFELLGLVDALQYTTYGASQHFDWHTDIGSGDTCVRKLSMTIQLSDGSEYQGGDLEFVEVGAGPQRALGTVTVFPSFLGHRVSPVTSGIRRSLVAWACGPSFR